MLPRLLPRGSPRFSTIPQAESDSSRNLIPQMMHRIFEDAFELAVSLEFFKETPKNRKGTPKN